MVHWPVWFVERSGSSAGLVHWPVWFIGRSGSLAGLVHWPVWFIGRSGSLAGLVHWPVWFIGRSGSTDQSGSLAMRVWRFRNNSRQRQEGESRVMKGAILLSSAIIALS